MVAASRRVGVARQVRDLVRDALAVRRHPVVRLLRLTRRHRRPAYFDIDDPALDGSVTRAATPLETAVRGATGRATQGLDWLSEATAAVPTIAVNPARGAVERVRDHRHASGPRNIRR